MDCSCNHKIATFKFLKDSDWKIHEIAVLDANPSCIFKGIKSKKEGYQQLKNASVELEVVRPLRSDE